MMQLTKGILFGLMLVCPRVMPQVLYYTDTDRGLYHGYKDCEYSLAPTLTSRDKAGDLRPCPHCLPRDGKQVASGNRQSSDGKAKNDVPKLTRHADVIGAR